VPIEAGQQLVHYRLIEKIGEGGMGVVWKAEDTALNREVAIKVLPAHVAREPERLARFDREAKLLASLNHANIASVYGLHEHGTSTDSVRFLAMEYVKGEDLAQRLARGRLSVQQVLGFARQVSDALQSAHETGVIHRDLKPANILITPADQVKVLDFGLAKAFEADASAPVNPTLSPTLTSAGTTAGVILGTAAYMSPEQARGEPVDKRADIWAFGCVLYEMLTGRMIFKERTISDTLASVLKVEPDWSLLPANVPESIRRLLTRCLEKQPRHRLHDIADARIEIEATLADPDATRTPAAAGSTRWPIRNAVAGALLLILGVALGMVLRPAGAPEIAEQRVRRFLHTVPANDEKDPLMPAISPDGRTIVYVFDGKLWLRDLDQVEARPLVGTGGARNPFWSPDSAHVGYVVGDSLWRIPAAGGRPALISDEAGSLFTAAWGEDDRIALSLLYTVATVPARGGEPSLLFPRRWTTEDHFHGVQWLPGGRGMLVEVHRYWGVDTIDLWADGERKNLLTLEDSHLSHARYLPSGHILFTRERNNNEGIWAVPFSPATLEVTGEPFVIVPGGSSAGGSADGTLIHTDLHPWPGLELVWFDGEGQVQETIGQPQTAMWTPALSPDGTKVAVAAVENNNERDIWIHDTTDGSKRRLTFHEGPEYTPHWSADGKRIYYHRYPEAPGPATLYAIAADGSARPQELTEGENISLAIESDAAAFVRYSEETGADIWTMALESDEEPKPFVEVAGHQWAPALSPDGRYLAYSSAESGQPEIYVTSFPGGSGKWQVSRDGGWLAYWSPARDRLYYHAGVDVMKVEVSTEAELQFGTPELLVSGNARFQIWRNIATGGEVGRFVGIRVLRDGGGEEEEGKPEARIHVVENWVLNFQD
jgi:Tol biopolymer transport system component/predicted Ser/Thr protein kinase